MRATIAIAGLAMASVFSGCMKDELPVPKQPRGGAVECVANVGVD